MNYGQFNGNGQHMTQQGPQGGWGGGQMPYGANERGHGWGGQSGPYEGQRGGSGGGMWAELLWSHDFADAVKRVCREEMNGVLAQQGYYPGGGQGQQGEHGSELHRRWKETLDEIRDAPTAEQHKLVEQRFEGLTPEERKLLMAALAPECSTRKLAAKAGLPVDRFVELKHGLKYKLRGMR